MNEKFWIDVISGTDRSVRGSLLRGALTLAEPAYTFATRFRNRGYDVGLLRSHTLACPVISVGNITTGGTGKTPIVSWLVKLCQSLDMSPGILSRGYRSLDGEENDEKRLLEELCPGVPHVQNKSRFTGGQLLLSDSHCNVIILDDGFQHRRLKRDLDIVLIDALNPWGNGHLLPRGLLRESLSGLSRAGAALITRSDLASPETNRQIETEVRRWTDCSVLNTKFNPTGLVNSSRNHSTWKQMAGQKVGAFCGIGNPAGFRQTLATVGIQLEPDYLRLFPDHYHYTNSDLQDLSNWASQQQFDILVTTRKDLVKIPHSTLGNTPLWGVDIGLELIDPDDEIVIRNLITPLMANVRT